MFYRLFYPRQSCFLTAEHDGRTNVTLVDWLMPTSVKPPMLAVALNNKSFSLDLVAHSKEFCVCILPETMREQATDVGSSTGKLIDKFDEYHIKTRKAKYTDAPLVEGSLAWVECRMIHMINAGDHTVVIGEVVDTRFPDNDDDKVPVLFNWGSKNYFGMKREREERKAEGKEERNGREEKKSDGKEERKEDKKDEKKSDAKEEKKEEKKSEAREEKKEPREEKKESKDASSTKEKEK